MPKPPVKGKRIISPFNKNIALKNEEGEVVGYKPTTHRKKLTPEIKEDIYEIIANGGTIKRVADRYKISEHSAWRWLTRDMPAYQDAMAARSSMRVEHMFVLVEDLIDKKIDPNTFKVIASAIQWCASKEGSPHYRDYQIKQANATAMQTNYVTFLEGEAKSTDVKEIKNLKEED